jgi:hypothetical protein
MNFPKYFSLIVATVFLLGCKEDDEVVPGGDDARLVHVNVADAVVMFSEENPQKPIEVKGHVYLHETLYKVGATGSLIEAGFTIEGKSKGGFDTYVVNDIDDQYFLISFYRREESYFINKKTGEAIETKYILTDELSSEYAVFQDKYFYYGDLDNREHVITRYLREEATDDEIVMDAFDKLYVDREGVLYYTLQDELYAYVDGWPAKVVDNCKLVYNDVYGNLYAVAEGGIIYFIGDGTIKGNTYLTMSMNAGFKPQSSAVVGGGVTLGLFKDEEFDCYLYNFERNKTMMKIRENSPGFEAIAMDSSGTVLSIFFSENDQRAIMHVDVSDSTRTETVVQTSLDEPIENIYTINEDMVILPVCEQVGDIECLTYIKYMKHDGSVYLLSDKKRYGTIIKL